jgi:hypothetical protein
VPRIRNISLVLIFAAILVAPTVAAVFRLNPMGGIDEKRKLAGKPTDSPWSKGGLARVPAIAQAWEKYFGDNFGLRKLLIGTYRLASFRLLQASPNPAVVVGESDGTSRWLYFDASLASDGVGLDSILGKKPYTAAELALIADRLRQVTLLVRGKGAKLVIAICPDKQTIYPEYLPRAKRPKPGAVSRLDQFWTVAAALDDVPLVDVRIPLRAAKADTLLYYPSDTHWNMRGEVFGYQAVARALAVQDPSREVLPMKLFTWLLGPPRVGDLTALMGLPAFGGDQDWLPVAGSTATLARPKRGKLLMISDSFFGNLPSFFELQFESVKRINRALYGMRGELVAPALLDAEKPDVVILESVERYWTE